MNKVELLGRLTRDVDTRYTETNNTCIASFTLAVNRRFAKKEDEVSADFINCVAFSKTAELITQYTRKGSQIAVVGRIQTRNWEDTEGQKHYVTEVVVEEVYFTGKKETSEKTFENSFGDMVASHSDFNPVISSTDDLKDITHIENDFTDDLPF